MKKLITFLLFSFFLSISFLSFLATNVSAHCPLCVGGAAIGLSMARFLGIDDSITGIWLAALLGALSFWSERPIALKIKSKTLKKYLRPVLYITIFGLTIWSFYAFNDYAIEKLKFYLLNLHAGLILGLPKLIFGIVVGGIVFYLVDFIDDALIKRNGKVYFPYQRVIASLGAMLVASLILYLLVNYYI